MVCGRGRRAAGAHRGPDLPRGCGHPRGCWTVPAPRTAGTGSEGHGRAWAETSRGGDVKTGWLPGQGFGYRVQRSELDVTSNSISSS